MLHQIREPSSIIAFGVQLLALTCLSSAADITPFDVLSTSRVTYNGDSTDRRTSGQNASAKTKSSAEDKLIIFPSYPGEPAKKVDYPAVGFLARDNHLPECSCFSPDCGNESADERTIVIVVKRSGKSDDVNFHATSDSIAALRRLSWTRFRAVQAEFLQWLFKKSAPPICRIFKPAACRFNQSPGPNGEPVYQDKLECFWKKCLDTAHFDDYAKAKLPPISGRPPRSLGSSAGERMGALLLRPGMRLRVAWGSTADYNAGTFGTINRQTQGGTTLIPVLQRNGRVVVGPQSDWDFNSVPPNQGKLSGANLEKFLPFGKDTPFTKKVMAVDNEFDLHQRPVPPSGSPNLFLLIPQEYTKADQSASFDGGTSVPFISDARDDQSMDVKDSVFTGLSRRFIIWMSTEDNPRKIIPKFTEDEIKKWYPAYVFGNQSWVSAEIPVDARTNAFDWHPVGTSWSDILQAYHPEASGGGIGELQCPLITIKRVENQKAGHTPSYRFWDMELSTLESVECHSGDSFR